MKIPLLIAFIAFAAYANSLHNPKMIDDHAFFDEKVRNVNYIWLHFLPDKNRALGIYDRNQDSFYRPLSSVLPMLSCLAFHDDAFAYHCVNLGLLIIAGWMIFILVMRLWGDGRLGFLVAAAYVVHPINGIMVNYITASVLAAQVIFMVTSLYFLISPPREGGVRGGVGQGASVLFFLLALLCHESAMGLPFYATALILGGRLKLPLRRILPLWVTMGIYLLWRMRFAPLTSSMYSNFLLFHMSVLQFIASFIHVVSWYLTKLFYPVGIVMIQSIPLAEGDRWFWLLIGLLMGLILFTLWKYARTNNKNPQILGLMWLAMGFIPVIQASVFRPPTDLTIEPHWLVFPVIGFFIWLASLFLGLWDKYKNKLVMAVLVVIMASWMGSSWGMNAIWGDEIAYCRYWLKYSPDYGSVKFFMAKAYEVRHDYTNARRWYIKASGTHSLDSITLINLGLMDMMQGRLDEAKRFLLQAVRQNPNLDMAWCDLGAIAVVQGQDDIAKKCLTQALVVNRFLILPRLNLAALLLKSNDVQGAQNEYQEILDINPDNEPALVGALRISWQMHEKDKVIAVSRRLLVCSQNPETLTNIGIMMQTLAQPALAQEAYQKAYASDSRYMKAKQLLEKL